MFDEAQYSIDGKKLLKVMIDKGYRRISDLSKATGINRRTLTKIVNGDFHSSMRIITRLIFVLEITPEEAGKIFFNYNLRKNQ